MMCEMVCKNKSVNPLSNSRPTDTGRLSANVARSGQIRVRWAVRMMGEAACGLWHVACGGARTKAIQRPGEWSRMLLSVAALGSAEPAASSA